MLSAYSTYICLFIHVSDLGWGKQHGIHKASESHPLKKQQIWVSSASLLAILCPWLGSRALKLQYENHIESLNLPDGGCPCIVYFPALQFSQSWSLRPHDLLVAFKKNRIINLDSYGNPWGIPRDSLTLLQPFYGEVLFYVGFLFRFSPRLFSPSL